MELNVYTGCLAVSGIITLLLTIRARSSYGSSAPLPADFKRFQKIFLATYYVSMTADWLQGPYVYALYSSYGFSKHDIAVLFVGGFGASMLFGTFIGAAADKMGRKRLCQVYCILYILSCATKHARHYNVLMLGRVLGIGQNHYPENGRKIIMVNVPRIMSASWALLSPVLHENTLAKIEMMRVDGNERLLELVGTQEAVDAMRKSVAHEETQSWGDWGASFFT